MKQIKKFGWIPDLPDQRDFPFAKLNQKLQIENLPVSISLREQCSPIEDQGELGSCTANAIAGALEYLDKQDGNMIDASRLFIYYFERLIEGNVFWDSGAYIRDGIKVLASRGYCDEILWPYDITKYRRLPNKASRKDASKRTIDSYYRCDSLLDVKKALAAGFPVVFGFTVYESAMFEESAKTGDIPMPGISEKVLGGHAVLAVGYNDETKKIEFRNSWGSSWGKQGYGTLPYEYIDNRNLSDDFWVITKL